MSSPSTSPTLTSTLAAPAGMPPTYMMTLKPGCRGDPRMNRAVAAKLKDPSLSLFDALHIGGFTYPRNVDAATIDNDRVTLGQRKNQLNRRLRLARQNLQNKDNNKNQASKGKAEAVKKPSVALGAGSPLAVAGSYLRQQRVRKGGAAAKPTATKRPAPATKTVQVEVAPSPAKKQCLPPPVMSTTTKANAITLPASAPDPLANLVGGTDILNTDILTTDIAEGTSLFNALTQSMIAEQPRGVASVSPVEDLSWATLPSKSNTTTTSLTVAQPVEEPWWPVESTTLPTATNTNTAPAPIATTSTTATTTGAEIVVGDQVNLVLNDQIFSGQGDLTAAAASNNIRCVSTSSFQSTVSVADSTTAATVVVSPTITATAEPTLVSGGGTAPMGQQQVLQPQVQVVQQQPQVVQQAPAQQQVQAVPVPTEVADPKEELGLRIFQANLQGLYQKSMVAAGFSSHEASLSSQAFHRFAFQAWKSECERLQVLLTDHVVEPCQPSPSSA